MGNQLLTLAQYMAGEFSNREQAIAEPVWYVNLRLWQIPLPQSLLDGIAFFAEQANIINLDQPYRQRIINLRETDGNIQADYYALIEPSAWRGAATRPEQLQQLSINDLIPLPDCTLKVKYEQETFKAELPINAKCCFTYQGETRQVSLGFAASKSEFLSYDKGIDMNTGAGIWGAITGAYRFTKLRDLSSEL
ncbi:CpeT/CpcT family (DUF1001) [Synechococcus sp. PCC 7502]|uniref:chromophore lyase CpcT/CpeT n=1 Tax=Synechococcus sp. PCC 7502 TaxID=1173263 RepID=UPI00029FF011|nr:chromophore lyase CpcT/CpeT [Synechococcus sp. PCC 7502]AFY74512.1 CpeT/CpcT family (DUF1001) [Synechococcus sp. PCC 7502]